MKPSSLQLTLVATIAIDQLLLHLSHAALGDVQPTRLMVYYENELQIGQRFDPFFYDGRGSGMNGTITDNGDGTADVFLPAETADIPPLLLYPPREFARIEIVPNDLVGTIDFCTGETRLAFDATFQPKVSFFTPTSLTVVTNLTTANSSGSFASLQGSPMNELHDLNLVGVAVVPKTDSRFSNWLLGLPTDAVTDMNAHFDFPMGGIKCPTDTSPDIPTKVKMTVGLDSQLSIGKRGRMFDYDALGTNAEATIDTLEGNLASFFFPSDSFSIPPLTIRRRTGVRIETNGFGGTIDICTGEISAFFDAVFTPYTFGIVQQRSNLSVVTNLTTRESQGFFTTVQGQDVNAWGDGRLVGVAKVPKTGTFVTDRLLSLPTDAVANLEIHFEVENRVRFCENA